MGTTRFWCGEAWQVVYSPDGGCIVVATWDEVFLLNSKTGKHIRCIRPVGNSRINSISLSPDGKALAMGTGGRGSKDPGGLQIFDLANGRLLHQCIEPGRQQYLDACFSPDGKMVASWSFPSKSIHVWNADKGQLMRRWPINSKFGSFIFDKDNKALIIGDEQNILFCDIASGVVTRRIENPGAVYRFALSPDGKTLASQGLNKEELAKNSIQGENSVHFWDVATGKKRNTIEATEKSKEANKGVAAQLSSFAFSPNGMILFTSSIDGTIGANGAYKGTLCAWDLDTAKELRSFESEEFIHRFSCAPDGKTLAFIGGGQTVRLWDPTTGKETREHPGPRHAYNNLLGLAIHPNGRILATGSLPEPDVRLWNTATGRQELRIKLEGSRVLGLHFSSQDGQLITLGDDKKLTHWDPISGQKQRQVQTPIKERYRSIALAHDGKTYASSLKTDQIDIQKVIIWDAVTGMEIREVGWASQINSLAFSADDRSVYCWDQHKIYVWDVATAKLTREFLAGDRQIYEGRFAPDGKWFVCCGRAGSLILYEMNTGKAVQRLDIEGMQDEPPSFAYSPDGRTLALGVSDGTIHLLELATRKFRYRLINGHRGAASALVFTPDGQRLVSGSADTTALVWDLTGRLKTKPVPLTPSDIVAFWNDLKSDDAARAYQAIRRFAGVPGQTIPFLDKNLQPIAAPDGKMIANHIADLESEVFAKRDAAMKELTKLGELAEPALGLALDKTPTLETRNRIKQLLDRLPNIGTSGEPLRQARAVEVLENIGNPQARQLLEKLAAGASRANLTRDA